MGEFAGEGAGGGEKAAVHRYVNEGKDVSELPFCQGHRKKMEQAKAYAEEVRGRAGRSSQRVGPVFLPGPTLSWG